MSQSSRWFLGLCGIFLLGLAVRLYDLGDEGLWLDELMHAHVATQPTLGEVIREAARETPTHSPSNHLVLHVLGLKRTSSPFLWRLPSALFGAMTIFAMGFLARRMFGDGIGLLSALVLALHPTHVYKASQEVGDYGQLVLVVALTALVFVGAMQDGGRWRFALFPLLVAASLYSHLLAVFFCCWLAAFPILCTLRDRLRSTRERRRAVWAVVSVGVGGLLYAPFFFLVGLRVQTALGGNWVNPSVAEILRLTRAVLGVGMYSRMALGVLCLIGALTLLGRRSKWSFFVWGWLLTALPIYAVFWWNQTAIRPFYLFPAFPALCITAAYGAFALGAVAGALAQRWFSASRWPIRRAVVGATASLLLIAQPVYGLYRIHVDVHKNPWGTIAAYLAERTGPDDVVICGPPFAHYCLRFYQETLREPLPLHNYADVAGLTNDELARLAAGEGNVWYVLTGVNLPRGPDVVGERFHNVSVFRKTTESTASVDLRKVALTFRTGKVTADRSLHAVCDRLIKGGHSEDAIPLLEERLTRPVSQRYATMWAMLAKAYEAVGRIDDAAAAWRRYAGLLTGGAKVRNEYAAVCAYFDAKMYGRAIEEGLRFLERHPDYGLGHHKVAYSYQETGDRGPGQGLPSLRERRGTHARRPLDATVLWGLSFGLREA